VSFFSVDADIQSVTLPAVSGDMGVYTQHVPCVVQLRPGVVEVNFRFPVLLIAENSLREECGTRCS